MKFMKAVKIGAVVLAIALACAFVFGPMTSEAVAFRHHPEFRAIWQDYNSKTLTFPPSAAPPANGPLDIDVGKPTQAAAQSLLDLWRQQSKQAMEVSRKHETLLASFTQSFDAAALQADLAPLDPLLVAFRAVASVPDFQLIAMTPSIDQTLAQTASDKQSVPVEAIPNFLSISTLAKLAQLKGLSEQASGHDAEALAWSQAGLAMARTCSYDTPITQLIGVAIQRTGARAQARIVASIGDAAILRQALKDQQALAARLQPIPADVPLTACNSIGSLRGAKLQGLAVADLKPMTERALFVRTQLTRADFIEKIILPKLANNPARAEVARNQANGCRYLAALAGGPMTSAGTVGARIVGRFAMPMLAVMAVPNFSKAHSRGQVAQAGMDLLELETARRIYVLEHGAKQPKALTELTQAGLAKAPADPFAKDGAAFRVSSGDMIYSIGPDGKDDAAAITYDPTNGSTSPGDVFFRRAPAPQADAAQAQTDRAQWIQ